MSDNGFSKFYGSGGCGSCSDEKSCCEKILETQKIEVQTIDKAGNILPPKTETTIENIVAINNKINSLISTNDVGEKSLRVDASFDGDINVEQPTTKNSGIETRVVTNSQVLELNPKTKKITVQVSNPNSVGSIGFKNGIKYHFDGSVDVGHIYDNNMFVPETELEIVLSEGGMIVVEEIYEVE